MNTGDVQMEAEHLTLSQGIAHASGNVCVTGENFYAKCADAECNIAERSIEAHDVEMGIDQVCISAQRVDFSETQIGIEDAYIRANLGLKGAIPNLRTKKITYDRLKKRGVARNTKLSIGKIPLINVPCFSVGAWIRFMDMRLDAGYTSKLGAYLQSEIRYHAADDLYLGMQCDAYSKRGILLGPMVKIDGESEAVASHLELKTGYISDRGDHKKDARTIDGVHIQPIKKCRWFIDLQQNHHLGQRIDFLSDCLWASDRYVEEDFKHSYGNDDIRDSFGELDYRGENYLLTLFTRVKMNRYQDFVQQRPSLRFELFPKEIGDTDIYYFGFIDFTRLKAKRPLGRNLALRENIDLNRMDSYIGLHRPTTLSLGVHMTPHLGGRWTHYFGKRDRFLGELGFDFDANFHALYSQAIPWLRAKAWKHVLRPIIKYRYISQSHRHIEHAIDLKEKHHFLPCIDLSEMRYVDDLVGQSVIRLGIENDFFIKNERDKIRRIGSIDFYQDFRFKRYDEHRQGAQQREERLSDFYIFSEFNPRRWLNLRLDSRFNWKNFGMRAINAEANFISGDLWQCGFCVKFTNHHIHQWGIHFCLQLNTLSKLDLSTQIDAKSGKFLAMEVGWNTCWNNVWDIRLFFKVKNRSRRESRFQPGFAINLMQW
ncbi:MAG: hypothetical protein LBB11_01270 [Puniceicoccales bacterium]|nr:hypothetical protein [Puniceicoccales bacterium]